jgi:hypothetical protein
MNHPKDLIDYIQALSAKNGHFGPVDNDSSACSSVKSPKSDCNLNK